MSEYMIMTDSTVDLPKEYLTEELGVPYIPLTYLIDGQSYEDMIGLTGEEFFAKVRAGSMPTTSQINPEQAREALEPYLKEGKDILYIAFSSGLSGTYNSIRMAAEELQEEYPERKLIVIDSLCACMGEGLLVYKAVQMKRAGKSLEEVAAWVEENKLHIMHNVTIDDLFHLHRGGRVSKASAIVGTTAGVVIAAVAAILFGKAAGITGYNVTDIETLNYIAQNSQIRIGQLLFSGIIISALGATMDVGMSIASTIQELHDRNPQLSARELFVSGIRVGRDMMGTMTNTLIFAYVGGSLSTLVVNYAYDLSYRQVMNSYVLGIEIMQGLSGSLGVVLTVPVTAAIAAFLTGRKKRPVT